jgi:hypothetical protein
MHLKKQMIFLVTLASLFMMADPVSGQPPIEMNFQGRLTDAAGDPISNEPFDLTVKLMSAQQGETELWSSKMATETDEEGWFSFTVPEISSYLMTEDEIKNALVISLEFLPNENTSWLKQEQDFMVTYTLTPSLKDDAIYLKMTRMEGSELTFLLDENLYMFKDDYPFAYLTGGFLLTDAPPLNDESVVDLKAWIVPDPDQGSSTRGVKGGFPKAGYSRKR